jgi:amino acid adenylation domain-containing protein
MPELLSDWVTLQAERRPDAVAVAGEGSAWSYERIEAASNRLARILTEAGCVKGDRVCLLMPKSPEAIAALIGVYKAGCIHVPLDPAGPAARLSRIVACCEPRWILAGRDTASLAGALMAGARGPAGPSLGWLDDGRGPGEAPRARFTWRDVAACPARPPVRRSRSTDPAHILFTSGSTGAPKGVVITHASAISFVEWAVRRFGLDPSDRTSSHPPLHFDLSVFDLFGTFAAGARLHLVPPELNLLPQGLAQFIRSRELTQWFSVPSVLAYMTKFDVVHRGDFPSLRRLLWCGEVFPTPALADWMRKLPNVEFTNLYGPTETTIASSHYTVPAPPPSDLEPIPIGSACDGEDLLILDAAMRPVADGQVGELYIGGVGLSPGYWNDPERTRDAFRADPRGDGNGDGRRIYRTGDLAWRGRDGLFYFAGRADTQVKSRGYRIELGEIEAGLGTLDAVRECAVVALPTTGFEGTILCCAYVANPGRDAAPATLRRDLSRLLPAHMLPARWIARESLPRNGNGKIDRAALKEEFARHETAADRHA